MKTVSLGSILRDIYLEPSKPAEKLAKKYGYLPYMVERYIRMLGVKEAEKLLKSLDKKLSPVVRTNTVLIDPDHLRERLETLGFKLEKIPWAHYSYRVARSPPSPSIGSTHEYLKGYYYVHRDAAALIPPLLLVDNYEGLVLDMCAAPGGKTTHLAQLLWGRGRVIANDLVLYRIRSLVGHIMRLKLSNIDVTWADARKLPEILKKRFYRILLDAPCSGEGTIMFDPGRKTRTTIKDLAIIVKREIELLNAGLDMLEKGGVLAYSTCSIAPEENEYVLYRVMMMRNDFEIIWPEKKLFEWTPWLRSYKDIDFPEEFNRCIRIWPHIHHMMGFTVCLLKKL
ncbi:MAG: RsmB/NOP family class I SAM-dependent RNA methyltransferase [Crenarchaeota archaeon]|nr:RsmB/NOP family class I SAM-dependent RNA methyltransferase [Thermoproteota archaeon]